MVYKCVAARCSNSSSSSTLYDFPKDPQLRQEWEKQVLHTRAHWNTTKHSRLCSEHFTADCFEAELSPAAGFGIKRRKKLKPGAIPTIFHRQSSSQLRLPWPVEKKPAPSEDTVLYSRLVHRREVNSSRKETTETGNTVHTQGGLHFTQLVLCFHIIQLVLDALQAASDTTPSSTIL